jgi:hypothetical protein
VSQNDNPSFAITNYELASVRLFQEFTVPYVKRFTIVCERLGGTYRARLYAEGHIRVIATGRGPDHLAALHELRSEVGSRAYKRENEELKLAEEFKNMYA